MFIFLCVILYSYQWMSYLFLILKTLIICIIAIAIRGTLPRYRFDQATHLNWKHFIYVWVVFLILNVIYFILFL